MIRPLAETVKACAMPFARAFVLPALVAASPAFAAEAPSPSPVAAKDIRMMDAAWFLIAGDGSPAASEFLRTARAMDRVMRDCGFTPPPENGRVMVYFKSGDGAPVFDTGSGRTVLVFPSGLFADESARARALARAALCRLAQAVGATPAPAAWAVGALAREARLATGRFEFTGTPGRGGVTVETALSTAPVYLEYLSRVAAAEGPESLASLAGDPVGADVGRHSRQGFWLLRAVASANRGDRRTPLTLAAGGMSLTDTLRRCVPVFAAGGEAAEAWWPAAYYAEVSARISMASTPDESERRYAELTRFVVAEKGADRAIGFEGLIVRRKDPALEAAIRRRLFSFKAELARVNPVWHNALLAYGVFLEKLSSPAGEAELRKLSLDAVAEAQAARATSAEIAAALAK